MGRREFAAVIPDNSKLREVLDWEPKVSLEDGLAKTYHWIEHQVRQNLAAQSYSTAAMEVNL